MPHRLLAGLLTCALLASAQLRVDPRDTYHRLLARVPLIGRGTAADPRRPLYAPSPNSSAANGIIGFTQVPTDDGTFAIVEFVALDRKAFAAILADTTITTFEKGVQSGATIEAALRKFKQGFTLVNFELVMP